MSTKAKTKKVSESKITNLKEIDKTVNDLLEKINTLQNKDKLKLLEKMGVGDEYFTCHKCSTVLKRADFYMSTESNCKSGITPICKKCAEEIAVPIVDNVKQQPTKESIIASLNLLRKPFLDIIWEASLVEGCDSTNGKVRSNVWSYYVKNMQMPNYYTLNYEDSDFLTGGKSYNIMQDAVPKDKEIMEQYEKNKADVIRLLGYEPFEKEKISDQPFLYSQLIGFLGSDSNNDMMRISSAISIVRGFLQQAQIDDMIARLMQDSKNIDRTASTLKTYQEMKKNIMLTITKLAQESCLSLKNSKNASKGEDTWTGRIKKLKDIDLRDAEVNAFDIGTSKGMQQVADISTASIFKQIKLDENDYTDMLSQQKLLIEKYRKSSELNEEKARILLRENVDLKTYMDELGILRAEMLTNETILTDYEIEDTSHNYDPNIIDGVFNEVIENE